MGGEVVAGKGFLHEKTDAAMRARSQQLREAHAVLVAAIKATEADGFEVCGLPVEHLRFARPTVRFVSEV